MTTAEPTTTPLFWLAPGAYVTPTTGEDAGTLYRVTGLVCFGGANMTSVRLVEVATGDRAIAAPYELDPADPPA